MNEIQKPHALSEVDATVVNGQRITYTDWIVEAERLQQQLGMLPSEAGRVAWLRLVAAAEARKI